MVGDRKSTRLNSSHTEIYTLSLHDALPILLLFLMLYIIRVSNSAKREKRLLKTVCSVHLNSHGGRSEEHTSELQSHRDLHSFPTRRSSDLVTFFDAVYNKGVNLCKEGKEALENRVQRSSELPWW